MRSLFRLPLLLGLVVAVLAPGVAGACPGEGAAVQLTRENQPALPAASVTLAPGSAVTYNYQVEELVSTTRDNLVDEGRYIWRSNWVDEGRYIWQSNWVDRGSWYWQSNWVDEGYTVSSGYWVGANVTSTRRVWDDTSHWAWNTHRNKYSSRGAVWYEDCASHGHDSVEGDCGGHALYYVGHWNTGQFWHSTGRWVNQTVTTWNPQATWVDTSYWQSNWVDRGSWLYAARWVDEGSWVWSAVWRDRGSWVWQANMVNRPITSSEWVTRTAVTAAPTMPSASATLRFVGTPTYNWVEIVEGCSSPT